MSKGFIENNYYFRLGYSTTYSNYFKLRQLLSLLSKPCQFFNRTNRIYIKHFFLKIYLLAVYTNSYKSLLSLG